MTTLKDISQRLNLSVTQVSRALNGYPDVNEATRKRVIEMANLLNYRPNMSARKLVSGRSGMVGLVLPSSSRLASDGDVLDAVTGLSAQFSRRDMHFLLHIAQDNEDIVAVYRRLIGSGSLDGFVLVEPFAEDLRIDFLQERGVPFVVHGRGYPGATYPFFDIDNFKVAHRLTTYLGGLGHERIALINGPQERAYAKARDEGFLAALTEQNLPFHPELLHHGRMSESLGLISTVEMFRGDGIRPTAIIAGNILIAKGIYRALEALGLAVAKNVSVVAHDDVLPDLRASAFFPALTVTRSPLSDSWSPLADFLARAIAGAPLAELQHTAEVAFVERASSAPNGIRPLRPEKGAVKAV